MDKSFAEVAMEMSGKSAEESKSIGKVDAADDQVEKLFEDKYQTKNSAVYKAVCDREFPTKDFFNFDFERPNISILHKCMETIEDLKNQNKLYDDKKLSDELLTSLSEAGYFGLLVPLPEKPAVTFSEFTHFLTQIATVEASVAGLASVHGCIGSVDPIKAFGNECHKTKYLHKLANGELLSAFGLTEPCAGSDLTALRTTARLEGDHYILYGEKLLITNATYGRLVSIVCLVDNKPQVILVELPKEDTENFRIVNYDIYALSRLHNNRLEFKDFKVLKENLIELDQGDGLTIAYHGLNLGRVSLCANASGCMKRMLESMIPWSHYRKTYGQEIGNRELVQNRIGKLAGYILSSDALVSWCSSLIDQGYRGELECIIAKTFGSECQKEAAIDLCMKTHGGRSFLGGHLIGDNIHDLLAPLIYEGEGDMLNMAFFKTLVKDHGTAYFEPVGRALAKSGKKSMSPMDMVKNYKVIAPYAAWMFNEITLYKKRMDISHVPYDIGEDVAFAATELQSTGWELSSLMRKYQLKLADKQCRISLLSKKIQNLITIIVTSTYASAIDDDLTYRICKVSCDNLSNSINGSLPTDDQIRRSVRLGKELSNRDVAFDSILMKY